MTPRYLSGAALALLLAAPSMALANVKMPAIFGDHMVLQQDIPVPVWGASDPGEPVTVTLGNQSANATAGQDGKWKVTLKPLTFSGDAVVMIVKGKNTVKIQDVLIGEVWVCSGQSNMEFPLRAANNSQIELPAASDPQMRLFHIAHKTAHTPASDVVGQWRLCAPDAAVNFTAVGYFFGRELCHALKRPVGLIESSWGGTPAQSWTSIEGLQKAPALAHYVDDWKRIDAAYALPASMPARSRDPTDGEHAPATLYSGMVSPIIPYAIRGVIWYQGEANVRQAGEYYTLFPAMIKDWREKWGEGNFPFLWVQLAGFHEDDTDNWPSLRDAQARALALPATGMATAVDIGLPTNIHPTDKLDVGIRLSLAARHVAYGENIVDSGPVFQSVKKAAKGLRVSFSDSDIKIGKTPWPRPEYNLPTDQLVGFEIAGPDGKWQPADATIDGATVIVSSSAVSNPTEVRYDWKSYPEGNLYNKENLPAPPFHGKL